VKTHVPACLENGQCEAELCPLSRVVAGTAVRIKRLDASPELTNRLREIGFCEEQEIKLVSRHTNLICLVCNARLGISSELADNILVQPVAAQAPNGTRAHAR
jgi:Fe2+ transport system protein FeoA